MSCFSCGGNFTSDTNALLRAYKEQYLKFGIVRYFYKTETNGAIKICRQTSFKYIYEKEIKPNFKKGAEYGCISEYA